MILGDARQSIELFRYFFAAYPTRSTLVLLAITAAALLPLISLVIDADGGGSLVLYVERAFALAGSAPSLGGLVVTDPAALERHVSVAKSYPVVPSLLVSL